MVTDIGWKKESNISRDVTYEVMLDVMERSDCKGPNIGILKQTETRTEVIQKRQVTWNAGNRLLR